MAAANGAPTLLTAWITAEPTPARSASSALNATVDAVASARPMPRPTTGVQPGGQQEEAERDRQLGARPGGDPVGQPRAEGQAADQRQQPQAAAHGVGAQDRLEVLRSGEQHTKQREDPTAARIAPHVKLLELNRPRSTSGWPAGRRLSRRSHSTNPTSTSAPKSMPVSALVSPQPSWPAWITP